MWEGFRGLGKEGKQKKWEGGIKKVWREASGNNVEEAKKRGSGRTRKRVAEMKGEKKGRIRLVDYARIIIIYHGLTVLNPLKAFAFPPGNIYRIWQHMAQCSCACNTSGYPRGT